MILSDDKRRNKYTAVAEFLNEIKFVLDDGCGGHSLYDVYGFMDDADDNTGLILDFEGGKWIVKE